MTKAGAGTLSIGTAALTVKEASHFRPATDPMSAEAATAARVSPLRVAVASFIGTTVEFYDFLIYGTAAALVFPKLFFPNASPASGVLLSFATFGVGFFARPLGGIVFGHFGDRLAERMLVYSLVGMGVSTVLIGCCPPTHTSASPRRSC